MVPILILFAHPAYEKSRVQRQMAQAVAGLPGITLHDLYEAYPTFDIDVPYEQQLVTDHAIIVLQHPFYWYSTPPLLKQWEDLVLEHGWAYGSRGTALHGKRLMNAISTGGSAEAYCSQGYNRFTIRQLLVPIEQTAYLCGMDYLPPFVVHGTHRLGDEDIAQAAVEYRHILMGLRDERIDLDAARASPYINAQPLAELMSK